jgi:hypothetical protein
MLRSAPNLPRVPAAARASRFAAASIPSSTPAVSRATPACKECGASLSGIVDPFDDALLITETAA